MSKLFTVAGTSKQNGTVTYRFATGSAKVRAGVLRRNGHENIELFDLPKPMTKEKAIAWLNNQGIDTTLPVVGRVEAVEQAEDAPIAKSRRETEKAELARIAAEAEAAQLAEDTKWIESLAN